MSTIVQMKLLEVRDCHRILLFSQSYCGTWNRQRQTLHNVLGCFCFKSDLASFYEPG